MADRTIDHDGDDRRKNNVLFRFGPDSDILRSTAKERMNRRAPWNVSNPCFASASFGPCAPPYAARAASHSSRSCYWP